MRINWTLLCNQVEVNPEGTYNLLGVIEELRASSIPLAIPQLTVVLNIKLISPGTSHVWIIGRLADNMQIVFHSDPMGHPVTKPGSGDPAYAIVPIYVHNLTLPQYGLYSLDVLKNERLIYSDSFRVRPDSH